MSRDKFRGWALTRIAVRRNYGGLKPTLLAVLLVTICAAQTRDLAAVIAKPVSRMIDLPGEFLPYLSVDVHAKVRGYVERVLVDRGSVVKQGELLVELSAPEMTAQIAEAESKVQAADA